MKRKYINNPKKFKPKVGCTYRLHVVDMSSNIHEFLLFYNDINGKIIIEYAFDLNTDKLRKFVVDHTHLVDSFHGIVLHKKSNVKERDILDTAILVNVLNMY